MAEAKYPNPAEPDDTPNTRTVKTGPRQIPEPTVNAVKQGAYEIPEPVPDQIPEPSSYGFEIEADILSNHSRLWRLEVYEDRHGKKRARRVLRFVNRPEPKTELGQVSEKLAEELRERPGKGRWRVSRDESEHLKLAAERIAVGFRRNKGLRRNSQTVRGPEWLDNSTAERGDMPQSQDDAQWPDMPDVLM